MSERELALADIRRAIYLHEYNPEALMAQIVALAAPPVGVSPQPDESSLIPAAVAWWFGFRPLSWDTEQHLANPTINAQTDRDKRLMLKVAALVAASLAPVEPTPEPPRKAKPVPDLMAALKESLEPPTPDAQVCVWREGEWDYESGCRGTQISRDERSSGPPDGWKHCPYCGKRLEVGTAPQGGEQ